VGVERRSRVFVAVIAAVAVLAPVSPALAATPVQEGYNAPGGNVQAGIQSRGANDVPGTTRAESSGALPFTGLDLAFVVVVGGGLVLLGGGLRRLSARAERGDG
jgi:hypothetical protein